MVGCAETGARLGVRKLSGAVKRFLTIVSLLGIVLVTGCGGDVSKPQPVEVRLSPDAAAIQTNQSVWFTATVLNASDPSVLWYVDGKAWGDSVSGTISPAGRYTAPGNSPLLVLPPFTVEVKAVSRADPSKSATAHVIVTAGDLTIEVSPAEVDLEPTETQLFAAHIENASDPSVSWSIDPVPGLADSGLIDGAGHYQAPDPIVENITITIRATSIEDTTRSAAALVHLISSPVVVTLSPDSARVGADQPLEMDFSVENTSETTLDWYVNGDWNGNTQIGFISRPGKYTAPAIVPDPPWVEIRAVSRRDTTKFAVCQVEIVPGVKIECEDMTQFIDRGGVTIGEVFKYNASEKHAIEGLDRMLEWIEIPVQFAYSGNHTVAFRNAARSPTDVRISILEPDRKTQGPEWILTVSGGGCG